MPKFRKKPVVVEAFQMTREHGASSGDWPPWLREAWRKDSDLPGALYSAHQGDGTLRITTLEGNMHVDWNDWIIQGVKGELYPCKPDIFEATYEAVPENPYDIAEGDAEGAGANDA